MKLHRIEINNLNSLYGVQAIDFDAGFRQAPLYLIMGPTGAGKTTILDAVCLALFGETPRLTDASGGASGVAERVMSWGEGTCKAVVEFSVRGDDGRRERYRATWRCHRAHQRPDGNVQDPWRAIERLDDGGWKELAGSSKQKDYDGAFKDALRQMTAQDFWRSVLLAQGQFTKFLKSDPDEKARILERLTRTSEYLAIGKRAAARKSAVDRQRQDLALQLDTVAVLSDEALALLVEELEAAGEAAEAANAAHEAARARLDWLRGRDRLTTTLGQARTRLDKAEAAREERAEDIDRLERARRAEPAAPIVAAVDRHRDEKAKLVERLPDLTEALEAADKALKAAEADKKARTADENEAKKAHADKKDEIEAAKQVRRDLDRVRQELEKLEREQTAEQERRDERAEALAALDDEQAEARRSADEARAAFEAVAPDEIDVEAAIAGDRAEQGDRLLRARDRAVERHQAVERAAKVQADRAEAAEAIAADAKQVDALEAKVESGCKRVEDLQSHLETCEARVDALVGDLDWHRDAQVLATKRQKLEPGEACPLCGSDEHPARDDDAHAERDAEVARKVAELERRLGEAKAERDRVAKKASEAEKQLAADEANLDNARKRLSQARTHDEELAAALAGHLDDAGLAADAVDGAEKMAAALEAAAGERDRARRCHKSFEALDRALVAVEKVDARAKSLRERLAEHDEALEAREQKIEAATKQRDALGDKAKTLLDGGDPAKVEAALTQACDDAEKARLAADKAFYEAQSAREKAAGERERAQKDLRETDEALAEATDELAARVEALEYDDAAALRADLLPAEELEALREAVQKLETAVATAKQSVADARAALDRHHDERPDGLDDQAIADADREALADRVAELAEQARQKTQAVGSLRTKIANQTELRDQQADLRRQMARVDAELAVWSTVHELIGVNSGGRFQRFAQAINLRDMVRKANHHLGKLHDRYRLRVATDDKGYPELDFEIADRFHAGKPRSLSTLSGGETFLVSLALALALADYRQLDMPIETLLLDEGFGTLDQASLDQALAILKSLHRDGSRQVGIISHVEGLKERIDHRIHVRPFAEGRSEIEVQIDGATRLAGVS